MPSWLEGTGPSPERRAVALTGQDPVAETFRQVEQTLRVGDQGAVAGVPQFLGGGRTGEELGEGPGEGDTDAQGAGAGEDLASGGG